MTSPTFSPASVSTSLPLSALDTVEFFKAKSQHVVQEYLIELDASLAVMKLESAVLRYVANMRMLASFDRVTPALLDAYIGLNLEIESPQLMEIHANLLSLLKYDETIFEPTPCFSEDDLREYVDANVERLLTQASFLDSLPLYLRANRSADGEQLVGAQQADKQATEQRKTMRDVTVLDYQYDNTVYDQINLPLLRLLTINDFVVEWLRDGVPLEYQRYFTRHFEEYMYAGKPLFAYLIDSLYFALLNLPQSLQAEGGEELKLTLLALCEHPQVKEGSEDSAQFLIQCLTATNPPALGDGHA